jgi:hypothetical protein
VKILEGPVEREVMDPGFRAGWSEPARRIRNRDESLGDLARQAALGSPSELLDPVRTMSGHAARSSMPERRAHFAQTAS